MAAKDSAEESAAQRATPPPTAAKKAATGRRQAKKASAANPTAAKKGTNERATARKAAKKAARKAARKAATQDSTAGPAGKRTAKKGAAKKAAAKKGAAKKGAAKKGAAKKGAAKKGAAKKGAAKKGAAKKAARRGTPQKTDPSGRGTSTDATAEASDRASGLAVREGDKPWTAAEVRELRSTLQQDRDRLILEISATEEEIGHLLREGGEGAGNDQADVGSSTFERDHEMNMAKTARESLLLVEGAISRLDDGTYGVCESCGQGIGKLRLQAFPRATLCLECKQRQERR